MNQTMTWTDIAAETWDLSGGDEPQWDYESIGFQTVDKLFRYKRKLDE